MTQCSQKNLPIIQSSGMSKKGAIKAYKKAHRSFMQKGKELCIGGSCELGTSCNFFPTNVVATLGTTISQGEIDEYYVDIQGEGECSCD